jgi:hypothetical protein
MLGEQTEKVEEKIELKPAKEMAPDSLQNPTDPDATYRIKCNNDYIGYVANVAETFDDKNRIITHYDLQQNTYSDKAFAEDIINKVVKQEEKTTILVDGAYYSEGVSKKAEANKINFVPTNLVGRSLDSENTGYEKFKIDEEKNEVNKCPMNHAPTDSKYKKQVYRAHFSKDLCTSCPHRPQCPVSERKKQFLFEVSETKLYRSILKAEMGTKQYQEIASKRAGVEGIPSTLRRQYNIDSLPVRGKVRSKIWLGLKIGAINCKRLIKGRLKPLILQFYYKLLEVFCYQGSKS